MNKRIRQEIRVDGVVQGVGFRPFVYSLATGLGLNGHVGNDVHGVVIEIEGSQQQIHDFLEALRRDIPPMATIEQIVVSDMVPTHVSGFTIATSNGAGQRRVLVSTDSAPCPDCLLELNDPHDRRFSYPFVNCTNCGPRFTIIRDVPYDRPLTTMAGFALCPACTAEYHDPADRRFHAQPTCCPACGPRLQLVGCSGAEPPGNPLDASAALLHAGKIVALKGLGGYHLAVLATHEPAVAELRRRKRRADKPFAIMVPDLAVAATLCRLDDAAVELLTSTRRPIVLLPRRTGACIAAAVAPGNRSLGLMLPYTPLHCLLLRTVAAPIVLTSGNASDEPIAYRDDDALYRLAGIADAFLTHNRPIHIRTDDSVVRPLFGRESVLRRSRGYVPEPIELSCSAPRPVLACGAELKNTFCLVKGRRAFLSQHIGDLENAETLRSFTEGIEHFGHLFDITPELVAHDLHPEYLSTKYAENIDAELVAVQHHHAHIASCLADNGVPGPVIGVAFDGLGYGSDGTFWGGEFLLADLCGFQRLAHLDPVPMPGGAAAVRQPWRMAAAYLEAAYDTVPPTLEVMRRNESRWFDILTIATAGINSPVTSSAGRLFDAVAALLGLRDTISYEGQAAIELEQLADPTENNRYAAAVSDSVPARIRGADLVYAVAEDLCRGVVPAVIAARFHNGVADMILRTCLRIRHDTGVPTVALSGGVFQNLLLLGRTADLLTTNGFEVLAHRRVPANDGGISLGQAAVAVALDRSERLTSARS